MQHLCFATVAFTIFGCSDTAPVPDQVLYDTVMTSDPTLQDTNRDDIYDWAVQLTELQPNLTAEMLQGGVVTLPPFQPNLRSQPDLNFPDGTKVTVVLKAASNVNPQLPLPRGAVFGVHYQYTDTSTIHIALSVFLDNENGQTAVLGAFENSPKDPTFQPLLIVPNLPADFVKAELTLHGLSKTLDVRVQGKDYGTLYTPTSPIGLGKHPFMFVTGWQESASFQSIYVTVPQNSLIGLPAAD